MWCTSRASPVSMTEPTRVRVFFWMRWWWTALTRSSAGIGARSGEECRSESTMTLAPAAMAASTCSHTSTRAWPRAGAGLGGAVTGNSPSTAKVCQPGLGAVLVDVQELGQLLVGEDRPGHDDLVAAVGLGCEQVALRADGAGQRGHQLLPDGIEGRVGHLGEQLLEVVVQQPGPVGQHRDRGVGPHGADRLVAGLGHRCQEDLEVLGRVAEETLVGEDRRVLRGQTETGGTGRRNGSASAPATPRRGVRRPGPT